MGLTVAQANSRLSKINTPEALRNLIKEIDARGVGQETLLWSGIAGYYGTNSKELITSEKVAASLQRAVPRIRTIWVPNRRKTYVLWAFCSF